MTEVRGGPRGRERTATARASRLSDAPSRHLAAADSPRLPETSSALLFSMRSLPANLNYTPTANNPREASVSPQPTPITKCRAVSFTTVEFFF